MLGLYGDIKVLPALHTQQDCFLFLLFFKIDDRHPISRHTMT
jgi:hypothetical protein